MSEPRPPEPAQHAIDSDVERAARAGGANLLAYLAHAALPLFHGTVTNVFGAAVYGLYASAVGILELVTRLSTCGTEIGLMRYVALHRGEPDTRGVDSAIGTALRTTFALGTLLAIALGFFARPVADAYGKPGVGDVLERIAPAVPFTACMLVLVAAALAVGSTRVNLFVRGLGEPLVLLVLATTFSVFWPNVRGLSLAHLGAAVLLAVAAVAAHRLVFGRGRLTRALRAPRHSALLRFSIPMAAAELLNLLLQRADLLILLYYVGEERLGIYAGAEFIARSVANARYAFDYVACPLLAEAHGAGDRARLRASLALMTRWVTLLAMPLALVLVVMRGEILRIFGEAFPAAASAFVVLVAAHFANGLLGLTGWVIAMAGHSRLMAVNALVGAAANIALNLWLIPRYGIEGAAWAALLSVVVFRGLELAQAIVLERAHPFSAALLRALGAGALALGVGLAARAMWTDAPLHAVIAMTAGALVGYVTLLVVFAPAPTERAFFARIPLLGRLLRAPH